MRAMCGQIVGVRAKIGYAEFGLHGNTYLLPLARFNNAMGGDDVAVRNGDDDGESGADLELFRQLVAMPPKKCLRAACSSMSLCGVATLRLPEQNSKEVQRQPS